ncbi:MAG: EpsD family peptidyl-prolyl cis-trans isomerase [Sulfuritalea sp.]|nr:EpsD family peptidyl-prolyl cis-trans isomerase [Sulfuritalea sp.]
MTRTPVWFIAVSVLPLLVACGEQGENKAATQSVAKVGNQEVTVHQLNALLVRSPNPTPEQEQAAARQAVERLIDQELLVQQALSQKADREPKTMQAIEMARRDILARSAVERISAGVVKPSPEDIKSYYEQNPALFAERRVYNLNEIVARLPPERVPELENQIRKARNLNDVALWLNGQNVPMVGNNTTKSAEQLPMELLPRFHQMRDGQIGVIPGRDGVLIVHLASSRATPVSAENAAPIIEQYLSNRRRAEAVDREIKSLREKTPIEYLGQFAQAPPSPADGAPKAETKQADEAAAASSLDKGLSGLK